jgi:PKD repeat protein
MYDWDTCKITVNNPTASLSANADGGNLGGYVTVVDVPITFYGVASGGEEPYIYEWDLADGQGTTREQNPTTTYKEEGIYTIILTVTDSTGDIATDTAEVIVQGEEEILVSAGGPYNTVIGVPVYFTATAAGGLAPYGYLWDFGDGSSGTTSRPFHIYDNTGTYTVTLTVTDSEGRVKTTTTNVNVDIAESTEVMIKSVKGGLSVSAVIQAGSSPVDWSISIDGLVIGGEGSGTIPAETERTVRLPISFGFGNVDITITANNIQDKYNAFMIGPFVLKLQEA